MPYITAWKIRYRCIEGSWNFSQRSTDDGLQAEYENQKTDKFSIRMNS